MAMASKLFLSALRPYVSNKNTGNIYEIAVALDLLRKMGVDDSVFEVNQDVVRDIIACNKKKGDEIRILFEEIKKKPVGSGLVFDGLTVTDIICATQDDSVGTGDFQLVTSAGIKTLSVCAGHVKRGGGIKKCLTNPSARRFGCTDADIDSFKQIEADAVAPYKKYMTDLYGVDESAWPSRLRTPVAVDACSRVALATAERFAGLAVETKVSVVNDILRIDGLQKPADYLALVNWKKRAISYFAFGDLRINADTGFTMDADGIYLRIKAGDKIIGSTQVKFNNGVYHKGKTSSIQSSWNATFLLTDVFAMKPIATETLQHA